MNLMVPSCKVPDCEAPGAVHGVEQVRNMWKRITIFGGYGVYCAIIYAHTQRTIRLWPEQYR